jgi:hypothetical protein
MFTDEQLTAAKGKTEPANDEAEGKLTVKTISLLAGAFRTLAPVARKPGTFSDLETRLAAVKGWNAIQLQAISDITQTKEASAGEAAISGGRKGLQFSKTVNRTEILKVGLALLYPDVSFGAKVGGMYKQMVNPAAKRKGRVDETQATQYVPPWMK